MTSAQYPAVFYHKDLAPEGVLKDGKGALARSAEEHVEKYPPEGGWVPSPAFFDPAYVPPMPLGADGFLSTAPARGPVQRYPIVYHHRNGVDDMLVRNEAHEASIDRSMWALNPNGPFEDHAGGDVETQGQQTTSTPEIEAANGTSISLGRVTGMSEADEAARAKAVAEKAAELHRTPEADAITAINDMTDPAALEQVKNLEALNPEPRVKVMKAVAKRLSTLKG